MLHSETVKIRTVEDLLNYKELLATIRQDRMLDEKTTKSKYDAMMRSIFFVRPETYENKTTEKLFELKYKNELNNILAADQSWKNIDWNEGTTKENIDPTKILENLKKITIFFEKKRFFGHFCYFEPLAVILLQFNPSSLLHDQKTTLFTINGASYKTMETRCHDRRFRRRKERR